MLIAESQLYSIEKQPNFPVVLLHLVGSEQLASTDANVCFAAALLFKNLVKRLWPLVILELIFILQHA